MWSSYTDEDHLGQFFAQSSVLVWKVNRALPFLGTTENGRPGKCKPRNRYMKLADLRGEHTYTIL